MPLTKDNRDLHEVEGYLRDRIDALTRERQTTQAQLQARGFDSFGELLAAYDTAIAEVLPWPAR